MMTSFVPRSSANSSGRPTTRCNMACLKGSPTNVRRTDDSVRPCTSCAADPVHDSTSTPAAPNSRIPSNTTARTTALLPQPAGPTKATLLPANSIHTATCCWSSSVTAVPVPPVAPWPPGGACSASASMPSPLEAYCSCPDLWPLATADATPATSL
ncbi:hypothetical protein I4F81_007902 [Pyropia yezoensis]|uniref:Uncharacterized protein n=1 Tax=Pyropia yezoensis TaxID=2788 RepID=A0ACC3C5T1_PYRYE|nr:hypothetical protein I4F81_007902 [Neopyropia yezoensis]